MSEKEWIQSDDAAAMLDALWLEWRSDCRGFKRLLHSYYLACCRAIWKLLPHEDSRYGIELAERYLDGEITEEELLREEHDVEGAVFCIQFNTKPDLVRELVQAVETIPKDQLTNMLHPPGVKVEIDARELLIRAAGFADFAMISPWFRHNGPPPKGDSLFLSADLLRKFVTNPFR